MTSATAAQETTWFGSRKFGQPTFYLVNPAGLIGRLMHLFHGLRFARQVGGKFVTIWAQPIEVRSAFDDPPSYLLQNIFELEKYRAEVSEDLVVFNGSRNPEATWLDLEGPTFENMRPDNFDKSYFDRSIEAHSIHYRYHQFSDENKSNAKLQAEVNELFRSMPYTNEVQEALKKAHGRLGEDSFVAIHVRRSDVAVELQRALRKFVRDEIVSAEFRNTVNTFVGRVAPPEAYFPEIAAAIAAKRKIVFSADVPGAIVPFEKHFGAEHFVDLATLVTATYPIQKAFCDFCILTKADAIVSTASWFARTAAAFGDARFTNVNMFISVEELERFAVDHLTPELAGERKMRDTLLLEISKFYERHKIGRGGRRKDFRTWLLPIRENAKNGHWDEALSRIGGAVDSIGPSAQTALADLRIRGLFKTGRLGDLGCALLDLGEHNLETALSLTYQFSAEGDPVAILRFVQQLHLRFDLTKHMGTRNIRFLVNMIERRLANRVPAEGVPAVFRQIRGQAQ